MASEIKPRMVDGEAFCDMDCPRYSTDKGGVELMCKDSHAGTCVAYYRARVAELEQQLAEARGCINEIDCLFEDDYPDVVERVGQLFDRTLKAEQQLADRDRVIEGVVRMADEQIASIDVALEHLERLGHEDETEERRYERTVHAKYRDELRALLPTPPEGGDGEQR